MVRIIKPETEPNSLGVARANEAFLHLLGIIIAQWPQKIKDLLAAFSIVVGEEQDEAVLTETLFDAIAEDSAEFNADLAELILDCCLENSYDNFNLNSLLKQNEQAEEGEVKKGSGGGMLSAISGAIQGVSQVVGKGLENRKAKKQATTQTLQNILTYKQQLAARAPASSDQAKSGNALKILAVSLFVAAAFGILAFFYSKRPQPLFKTPAYP